MKKNNLLAYETIEKAVSYDPVAVNEVVTHFYGLITVLSSRQVYNENGKLILVVDEEMRDSLQTKLINKLSHFKLSDTQNMTRSC